MVLSVHKALQNSKFNTLGDKLGPRLTVGPQNPTRTDLELHGALRPPTVVAFSERTQYCAGRRGAPQTMLGAASRAPCLSIALLNLARSRAGLQAGMQWAVAACPNGDKGLGWACGEG